MKKMKKYIDVVVLVLVGTMMSGCSEEIEAIQSANQTVIQKTTISLADNAVTRGAIDPANGKTTFSTGDQIAVIYQNTDNKTVKAVSAALTSSDLFDGNASATFTLELTNPLAGGAVLYIYPAAMAADDIEPTEAPGPSSINYTPLATQDGTIESLAKDLNLSTFEETMTTAGLLPVTATLTNHLAIVKLQTIKNDTGASILDKITNLTISDGINSYTVNRTAEDTPIFVAMLPTSGNIIFSTTIEGVPYTKTATTKTLEENKIYPINLTMAPDAMSSPD